MESFVIRCVIVILLAFAAYTYEALCRQPDLSDVDESWLTWYGSWTALLGSIVAYGVATWVLGFALREPWLAAFIGPATVVIYVFRLRSKQRAKKRELERRMESHRRWHERMGAMPWRPDWDDDDA